MASQPFSLSDLGAEGGRCEMEQMALRCQWACATKEELRQPVPRVSENFVSDWIS